MRVDNVDDFIASVQAEYRKQVSDGEMGTILFTDAEYEKLIQTFIEQADRDGTDVMTPLFSDKVVSFIRMCEQARLFDSTVNIVLRGVARPRIIEDRPIIIWPLDIELVTWGSG